MKITSVKGTNDYLPNEVEIRDYLQERILSVYKENGFEHIITPAILIRATVVRILILYLRL